MRKKPPHLYFLLFFSLMALMSLPKKSTEKLRGSTIAALAPTWKPFTKIKEFFVRRSTNDDSSLPQHCEELQRLSLENSLLRSEILHLKEAIQQELRMLSKMTSIPENPDEASQMAEFLKMRHYRELQKLLKMQLQAIPAHVIFRSPASWNSSLWIDVGTDTNHTLGSTIIAKNSPVLLGTSIVGVIDYVGIKQSRVRLLTDSGLTPSVRVLRTTAQSPLVVEKIHSLIQLLEKQNKTLDDHQEQEKLITQLENTAAHISNLEPNLYLAKGEIHGSGKPLWRTHRHLLKGIGFNYDFADGEGPARDLRTGQNLNSSPPQAGIPILKPGDLLVTTGMDGVFPPDLLVAEVTKVHPLKEGDYYYELDALPTAGNIDELSLVFVLPPVGYDEDEQPPPIGR